MDERRCFCCDKIVEFEKAESPTTLHPVYEGLWFRASGNFGSTIFDPLPPYKKDSEFLQIVICDDCIVKKADRVDWVRNIRSNETADVEPFASRLRKS